SGWKGRKPWQRLFEDKIFGGSSVPYRPEGVTTLCVTSSSGLSHWALALPSHQCRFTGTAARRRRNLNLIGGEALGTRGRFIDRKSPVPVPDNRETNRIIT